MAEDSGTPVRRLIFLIQGLLREEYIPICPGDFPWPYMSKPPLPSSSQLRGPVNSIPQPCLTHVGFLILTAGQVEKYSLDTWYSWLSSRPMGDVTICPDTNRPKHLLPPSFRASIVCQECRDEKDRVMTSGSANQSGDDPSPSSEQGKKGSKIQTGTCLVMVLVTTINVIMFESQLTQEEGEASAFIWVGCIILTRAEEGTQQLQVPLCEGHPDGEKSSRTGKIKAASVAVLWTH